MSPNPPKIKALSVLVVGLALASTLVALAPTAASASCAIINPGHAGVVVVQAPCTPETCRYSLAWGTVERGCYDIP